MGAEVGEDLVGAGGQEVGGQASAEGVGFGHGAAGFVADGAVPVGRGDQGGEGQLAGEGFAGQGSDGGLASAFDVAEEGSLGGDGPAGGGVVEDGQEAVEGVVLAADLEAEGALGGGGQHAIEVEQFHGVGEEAEASEPGPGEDGGGIVTVADLGQAGVDVAANVLAAEVGAEGQELGAASEAAGADAGPVREVGQGAAVGGDAEVARVLTLGHGLGEAEAVGGGGGEVLEAVHGQVDATIEEGEFEFAGEEAGAFGSGQVGELVPVAAGLDDLEAEGAVRVSGGQSGLDGLGLGQGQRAAAGADEDVGREGDEGDPLVGPTVRYGDSIRGAFGFDNVRLRT